MIKNINSFLFLVNIYLTITCAILSIIGLLKGNLITSFYFVGTSILSILIIEYFFKEKYIKVCSHRAKSR
jgi:hypothetical protein